MHSLLTTLLRRPFTQCKVLGNSRRNTLFSRGPEILLAHIASPTMSNEVSSEPFVLYCEVLATEIRDEEVGHKNTDNATDGSDDESPFLAEMVLDWGKRPANR